MQATAAAMAALTHSGMWRLHQKAHLSCIISSSTTIKSKVRPNTNCLWYALLCCSGLCKGPIGSGHRPSVQALASKELPARLLGAGLTGA